MQRPCMHSLARMLADASQVSVYNNLRLLNKIKDIDYKEETVLWADESEDESDA